MDNINSIEYYSGIILSKDEFLNILKIKYKNYWLFYNKCTSFKSFFNKIDGLHFFKNYDLEIKINCLCSNLDIEYLFIGSKINTFDINSFTNISNYNINEFKNIIKEHKSYYNNNIYILSKDLDIKKEIIIIQFLKYCDFC